MAENSFGLTLQIVRVGPNELSYVTEEAWNDIYKTRKGEEQLKKLFPQTPNHQHGLMDNPFDDEQAICRKILASAIMTKPCVEKRAYCKETSRPW
jgi:hypothetical protein